MKILNYLVERKLGWQEHDNASPVDQIIDTHIRMLIDGIMNMEAKWGVGRIERQISEALKVKWDRQCEKLIKAIDDRDFDNVRFLTEGCIRAFDAIDQDLINNGFAHYNDFAWGVDMGDKVYIFVKCLKDERLAPMVCNVKKPYEVVTIEQCALFMINDFERRMKLVNDGQGVAEENSKDTPFNFDKGDDIPWDV